MSIFRVKNKFNAKKVKADGYTFDSKGEYERYCDLVMFLKCGAISDLKVHPRYPISINGIKVCDVVLDFQYKEKGLAKEVAEDFKGWYTSESRLRHKMFKAMYPEYEFRLTRRRAKK